MLSKHKTTFFIVLGLIVLFFVWNVFLKTPKEPESLLIASSSDEEAEILGQPIVDGIAKISKLKTGLDKSILSNPVFLSLTKEGGPILPEPVGKSNPFASIDATASVNNSTSTSIRISTTTNSTSTSTTTNPVR